MVWRGWGECGLDGRRGEVRAWLVGWGAGVAIGSGAAAIVALATGWRVAIPTPALLLSFAMALATGPVFGVLPARKAALVPPIRALLSE